MTSFMPTAINQKKETDLIKDNISPNMIKHPWKIDTNPFNEYKTEFLATLSFPSLFPDGKGDPMNNALVRNISENETEAFSQKIKHLIKFAEKINGKWVYRFASHPRFGYWAFNILYRRRLLSQGNFFIKQNPGEANLTFEELQEMLSSGSYSTVMSKLMHYAKNVTGTNAYWNQTKEQLKATITQVGAPTIFWTLSCADFHWPEFHTLFSNETNSEQLRSNVINNPHLIDWLFTNRTEKFVKWWMYKSLGATWHWYRYEFAVQRGSIHCHGVAKLASDPGLCQLTGIALKGFLAAQKRESLLNDLTDTELSEIDSAIREGMQAEKQVCDYVDQLMSTCNPCHPDEGGWAKPGKHPCKIPYLDIDDSMWDEDYENLLNSVQRHTLCNSAYCLRQKRDGTQYCRFDFPIDTCSKTHINFEKVHTRDKSERYRAKIVTERDDSRLNRHQRLQLQGWRANCDINVVIDYHSCVEYLTKYASKAEKLSNVARDAFVSVVNKLDHQMNGNKAIKQLMMKAVGERDMSAQEVMHQLLSLKLYSSSYHVITTSLNGSRKFHVADNTLQVEPSVLDDYAARASFVEGSPDILHLNFIQFVSQYFVKDCCLKKRTKPVIVRTFPTYSSNPQSQYYGLFCKYQLLRYKPWINNYTSVWENEEEKDSTFISHWNQFLQTEQAQQLVPNWSRELDTISAYIEGNLDDDTDCETGLGEREEWMFLAELNMSSSESSSNSDAEFISSPNYWQQQNQTYTEEQIGNIPTWIEQQKESFIIPKASTREIDINTFNEAQEVSYKIVFDHFMQEDDIPLLLIMTGLAGSGKSYVIDAMKNLLKEKCKVCAYFGIAAFNVKGQTLHSVFQLPIKGKRSTDLRGQALKKLQDDMLGIKYVIMDEYSVIGQKLFGWIDRRCKQATGQQSLPFGGISIILVGDIAQLPPVTDKVLYHNRPSGDIATIGFCAYRQFMKVVKLTVNERAKGSDIKQEDFRNLQIAARDGNGSVDHWHLLLTRTPGNVKNIDSFQKDSVKLSFGNEKVAKDNYEELKQLNQPIATINAKHNNKTASKLSSDDMGSLMPQLLLSEGAKVMLTRNLWTEAGLCNGAIGIVKDIVYMTGCSPPALPVAVIVQFDDNYIGPSISEDLPRCVPIIPVTSNSDTLGSAYERQQLPLRLAWSITIHKSQGLTLNKAWIDLGTTEKVAGLACVALSRVKCLDDLIIEPMTLERLCAVKNSSNYKFRLLEEQRLHSLAQQTLSDAKKYSLL